MSRHAWKITMMALLTAAAFCTVKAAPGGGEGEKGKGRGRIMKRFDTDGDGVLSDTEKAAMEAARQERMSKRFDTDGDGVLSDTEKAAMETAHQERLAKYDTDKDGKLSKEERAAMPKPEKRHRPEGKQDGEQSEE